MALQGFDEVYYLQEKLAALQAEYPDWIGKTIDNLKTVMAELGMTPEQHYMEHGYQEGLHPNGYFNAEEYIAAKAQQLLDSGKFTSLAEAEAAFKAAWPGNPYDHYIQHGAGEGINPSNAFDASAYMEAKLAALKAADPEQWGDSTVEQLIDIFIEQDFTPLSHYMEYGKDEDITVAVVPADEQVNPGSTDGEADGDETGGGETDGGGIGGGETGGGETGGGGTGGGGTGGATFNLSIETDELTGTAKDDTFNAPLASSAPEGKQINTLQDDDKINGGDGNDTMNITLYEVIPDAQHEEWNDLDEDGERDEGETIIAPHAHDDIAPEISGIEKLVVHFTDTKCWDTLSLRNATGVENIKIDTGVMGGGVHDVGPVENFSFVNNQDGDKWADGQFVNGTATNLNISLDNFKSISHGQELESWVYFVDFYNLETVNLTSEDTTAKVYFALSDGMDWGPIGSFKELKITATGTNMFHELAASTVENITITGEGSVAFTGGVGRYASLVDVKTFDASANKGGVDAGFDGTATKIIGSSGNDDFWFSGSDPLSADTVVQLGAGDDDVKLLDIDINKGFSIDGGEGRDTLKLVAENFELINDDSFGDEGRALITNFENLFICEEQLKNGSVYDLARFDSFSSFISLGVEHDGVATLKNVDAGVDVNVILFEENDESALLDIQLKNASENSDVLDLNLALEGCLSGQASFTAAGVENLNVGSYNFTNQPSNETFFQLNLTPDNTALETLNIKGGLVIGFVAEEELTALEIIDASENEAGVEINVADIENVTVTGTAKDDMFTLGTKATVTGGLGEDTFNIYSGADDSSVSAVEDFGREDMLMFNADFEAILGASVDVSEVDSLKKAIEKANGINGNNAQWFVYDEDTYITVDKSDNNVAVIAEADTVVKLTGVYDLEGSGSAGSGQFTLAEGAIIPD